MPPARRRRLRRACPACGTRCGAAGGAPSRTALRGGRDRSSHPDDVQRPKNVTTGAGHETCPRSVELVETDRKETDMLTAAQEPSFLATRRGKLTLALL